MQNRKVVVILIALIVLTSLIKLNPLTKSAQVNKEFIVDRSENMNISPFSTIKEYIVNVDRYNTNIILKFFAINLILYLPVAFFLGLKDFDKLISILIIVLLPIVLDILQIVFRIGSFDIDSIILNVLSSLIIFGIARKVSRIAST
ncbi:VanZ family protein [Sedimentibacter sp.]|uniref:VanZ family protein n=1 Tax=Sedimentibacter sp. TaxID=1960295 RepID=UPI0028993931|nr:VanZ family protein [Sedimentibacter sp.]